MRELMLRSERSFQHVERSIARHTEAVEQITMSMRKLNRDMDDHRREFRAEYEAQRGSLLAILDRLERLNGGGGTAPAT